VSGSSVHRLSRTRVWLEFCRLAFLRATGHRKFAPLRLSYPPLSVHAAKNPWQLYREIFVNECYSPPVPLSEKPRILDLGANVGMASLYFLTRWPQARLTAFEPNPRAFALLTRNLSPAAFPAAEIQVEDSAISTAEGTVEFAVPVENPTAVYASISQRAGGGQMTERVTVPTVDARRLFAVPVDLVKLDIEGHEYPVLEHALPAAGTVRSLIIEFHEIRSHGEQCRALLTRLLGEQGYEGSDEHGRPLVPAQFAQREGSGLARLAARRTTTESL
jgi:FkbM family methyltransferase